MRFIVPDHEHGETDEERERNVEPEQVVNDFGVDVARRHSFEATTLVSLGRREARFVHTIIDCTDKDGGETQNGQWDENALRWVLD